MNSYLPPEERLNLEALTETSPLSAQLRYKPGFLTQIYYVADGFYQLAFSNVGFALDSILTAAQCLTNMQPPSSSQLLIWGISGINLLRAKLTETEDKLNSRDNYKG